MQLKHACLARIEKTWSALLKTQDWIFKEKQDWMDSPPKTWVLPNVWILLWNQYSVGSLSNSGSMFLGTNDRLLGRDWMPSISRNSESAGTRSSLLQASNLVSSIIVNSLGDFTSPLIFSTACLNRWFGSGDTWKAMLHPKWNRIEIVNNFELSFISNYHLVITVSIV